MSMSEKIFANNSMTIWRQDGRYYIEYDSGDQLSTVRRDEITAEEAVKAQQSPKDAYAVILAAQKRTDAKKAGGPL